MKIEVIAVAPKVEETPFIVGGVYRSLFTTVCYVLSTVPEYLAGSTKTHALTSLGDRTSTFLYTESEVREMISDHLCYIPDAVLRIPSKETK
jgi:hypothetical protein